MTRIGIFTSNVSKICTKRPSQLGLTKKSRTSLIGAPLESPKLQSFLKMRKGFLYENYDKSHSVSSHLQMGDGLRLGLLLEDVKSLDSENFCYKERQSKNGLRLNRNQRGIYLKTDRSVLTILCIKNDSIILKIDHSFFFRLFLDFFQNRATKKLLKI